MAIVRESSTQVGLSEQAAFSLIASNRRESMLRMYNSCLAGFYDWCDLEGVDSRSASESHIADFLIILLKKGVNVHNSWVSFSYCGFSHGWFVYLYLAILVQSVEGSFPEEIPNRKLLTSWSPLGVLPPGISH